MSDDVTPGEVEQEEATVEPEEDGGPEAEEVVEVDPLTQAQQEAADYKDRWMRSVAEFDNYRKRMQRENSALFQTASESVVRELLPILDGIERALAHGIESETDSEAYRAGIQMIMEQFPRVLESRGLKEIESKGQPFDPNEHEALMQMPSDEYADGVVSEVVEKGYRMGDRVIRPAKVVVSNGEPQAGPDGPAQTSAPESVEDQASAE